MRVSVLALLFVMAAVIAVFYAKDSDDMRADGSVDDLTPRANEQTSVTSIGVDRDPEQVRRETAEQAPVISTTDESPDQPDWADANLPPDEAAWFRVPFEDRQRRFRQEGRDLEWAESTERSIAEEIASWNRPPVQLLSAACRSTLCEISMYWPSNPNMPDMGQQLSYLYRLGLDHQGNTHGVEEGNGYLWVVIARRR